MEEGCVYKDDVVQPFIDPFLFFCICLYYFYSFHRTVLWNAAWGGLTTLARQPVYVLLEDDNLAYTVEVVRKIMLE